MAPHKRLASVQRGLTRRTVVVGGLAAASIPTLPAYLRVSRARPVAGVRFVAAAEEQAQALAAQYNMAHVQTPRLRALCSTAQGVADTVRWAQSEELTFAVRSGGHCYAGTSAHADLVIDLRDLARAAVDPSTATLVAEPGARLRDVYRAGYPHDLTIPAGWCGDVGIGGHLLGGGIGYRARAHGLLCDQLESVTLVTADGQILHCTVDENSALYWASRGGGGGLGIAMQYRVRMQSAPDMAAIRAFGAMSAETMPALMARWMAWSSSTPRHTTSQLSVTAMSDGRLFARLTGLSEDNHASLLDQLHAVAEDQMPVDEHSVIEGSFGQLMDETFLSVPAFYLPSASHSAFLPDLMTTDALEALCAGLSESRAEHGAVSLLFETMGGALAETRSDQTAFPHRDAKFLVSASHAAVDVTQLDDGKSVLDMVGALIWEHASGTGYANYRDRSLINYAQAYWGANVPRLQAIKRAVDPDGVFTGLHTIPL